MDKAQALHSFWSSFGLTAVDENSAYDDTVAERLGLMDSYITYEVMTGNYEYPVPLVASLWYRSQSWAAISQKADEIADAIGVGGKVIKIDNGYLWIKQRQPFTTRLSVDGDYDMRRIMIYITANFMTAV